MKDVLLIGWRREDLERVIGYQIPERAWRGFRAFMEEPRPTLVCRRKGGASVIESRLDGIRAMAERSLRLWYGRYLKGGHDA